MASAWIVHKYIPEKLYGFVVDMEKNTQVFFHLGVFRPGTVLTPSKPPLCRRGLCTWPEFAPPILGEPVRITLASPALVSDKAPRASQVDRITSPKPLSGVVESFDAHRGFGFILGEDGTSYHLHKSEIQESRVPLQGQIATFFAGLRQGRPRACHVKLCSHRSEVE